MKRRDLIAGALAAPFVLGASRLMAAPVPLAEISSYLNGIKTAKSDFTQINDDGSISTGQLYIKRPGRVRFEYDPPNAALVIAGAGSVSVFDSRGGQGETYPLSRTPLSIILDNNVDLGRARMVTGHDSDGTATTVTAQDPDHPEYGNIRMVFTGAPVELRQWVISNDAGETTTVVLGALQTGVSLSDQMFLKDLVRPGRDPSR